jgi:hypothetical protein
MAVPLVILAVVVAFLFISQSGSAASDSSSCCGGSSCMITNDPATWPTGDKVWDVCRAIAIAEGANIAGSNPDKLNNPGDISDGSLTYGFELHSGSSVTKFPDKSTGWNWLYAKIQNALVNGSSQIYSPDMTWTQLAQKYSGDWQKWVNNVTSQLGVSPDSRSGDYFLS